MGIKPTLKGDRYYHVLMCMIMFCFLMVSYPGNTQHNIALGKWRLHVPYHQGKSVADAGDRVYVAAERGLFYYDKEFNSTQTISKVNGLREQHISKIAYDPDTKTLVVAYASTNIDLIRGGKVININDISRKAIPGEKRINSLKIDNKHAYISSTFGVIVLDLVKLEIRDTYSNLGPNGELVNVKESAILRDSIYLATNLGVLSAKRQGLNLQDFRSWRNISYNLPAALDVSLISSFNGNLYSSIGSGLYKLQGKKWTSESWAGNIEINSLNASSGHLTLTTNNKVILLDKNGNVRQVSHSLLTAGQEAEYQEADKWVWIADGNKGLLRINITGAEATAYAPNGPFAGDSFGVYTYDGKTVAVSGGYSEVYLNNGSWNGFYTFSEGTWQNYNKFLYPATSFVKGIDLVGAVYNPVTSKLYLASYGNGLIEWSSPEKSTLYNGYNSPLLSALSSSDKTSYIRVTDVEADMQGNVWVVNRNQFANAPGLHMLQPDGTWKSFVLPNVADGSNLDQIVIDDNGYKWLSIARRRNTRGGVVVFDDKKNTVLQLSIGEGAGGLPNADVYAMAKDLNGDIWVGTAGGVGVFYNPGMAFSAIRYDARIPIIDRRPLLDGQVVRTIAVDGANRKWMGTDNGLWLFNPEGDKLIKHFTMANSPLPSDKILSVAVENRSGEVFVATDAGIASYRAEATITEGEQACAVVVYPNPVKATYTGIIGVSGLPNNADVHITDITGTLVYKTKATGGTLAWDVRDYNGKRVKAGVYLVMSSSVDGQQTCITKLAVLD